MPVEIAAETDVVFSLDPVQVHHVLILRIVAVVRHEVVVDADGIEAVEVHLREAALKLARAVRSGDAQYVQADVFADVRLLGGRSLPCKAEVCVQDEVGRERVGAANRGAVRFSMPVARIAATPDRPAEQFRAENGRRDVGIMEETEAPEHVQFAVHVPVDLGIDSVAIETETTGGEVIVAQATQVRFRPEADDLLRDQPAGRVQQALRNDVHAARVRGGVTARIARSRHGQPLRGVGNGRARGICIRIIDDGARQKLREIPGLHGISRHGYFPLNVAVIVAAFVAHEVKQLVLLDRPSDRAAELVVNQFWFL